MLSKCTSGFGILMMFCTHGTCNQSRHYVSIITTDALLSSFMLCWVNMQSKQLRVSFVVKFQWNSHFVFSTIDGLFIWFHILKTVRYISLGHDCSVYSRSNKPHRIYQTLRNHRKEINACVLWASTRQFHYTILKKNMINCKVDIKSIIKINK